MMSLQAGLRTISTTRHALVRRGKRPGAAPAISSERLPKALVEQAATELLRNQSRWRTESPIDALVAAAKKPLARPVYR